MISRAIVNWIVFAEAIRLPFLPQDFSAHTPTLHADDKSYSLLLQTALIFTWEWFIQIAKKNPHVDNWFWGHEGIVCGKTESEPDCSNRMDWNVQQKTIEAIENDQPTLTFIHFGMECF